VAISAVLDSSYKGKAYGHGAEFADSAVESSMPHTFSYDRGGLDARAQSGLRGSGLKRMGKRRECWKLQARMYVLDHRIQSTISGGFGAFMLRLLSFSVFDC